MKTKASIALLLFLALGLNLQGQSISFSAEIKISPELKKHFNPDGRIFLLLSENLNAEPYTQLWPNPRIRTYIFAKNMDNVDPAKTLNLKNDNKWTSTADWTLDAVPAADYNVQVLWDQDTLLSRIDAAGNLYSENQKVTINKSTHLTLTLNQQIKEVQVIEHDLVKTVHFKSEMLSAFWNKSIYITAAILLPLNYDNKKAYAIRYNVPGYGSRYTRINRLLGNDDFMKWWDSDEAPQIITVFLDGEGPFGDSYYLNSDNSGPYGDALIEEFIPHIESEYRGTNTMTTRFVDGCSTGGWVSLGLQLYYPDVFNGTFSYSPDAVDFENYQLVNIYKDKNAFVNEFGYDRPVMRSTAGEPMVSMQDFIKYENVQGASNTYLNSGGQFSAHTALYSPKGSDGLPIPLIDPLTGVIDSTVALYWKKYDFKHYAQENWEALGPKIQGKIFIWMGDMDNFYLNPATRALASYFETTANPKSDAEVVFAPMEGHCSLYDHRTVLMQIQERMDALKKQ
jgi:enterochelin esterase-like enzyme